MAEAGPPRLPEPVGLTGTMATIPVTFTGEVPATLLDAYRRASDAVDLAQPGCHLPMELLAAIGKVETNHAQGGRVDSNGLQSSATIQVRVNGGGSGTSSYVVPAGKIFRITDILVARKCTGDQPLVHTTETKVVPPLT